MDNHQTHGAGALGQGSNRTSMRGVLPLPSVRRCCCSYMSGYIPDGLGCVCGASNTGNHVCPLVLVPNPADSARPTEHYAAALFSRLLSSGQHDAVAERVHFARGQHRYTGGRRSTFVSAVPVAGHHTVGTRTGLHDGRDSRRVTRLRAQAYCIGPWVHDGNKDMRAGVPTHHAEMVAAVAGLPSRGWPAAHYNDRLATEPSGGVCRLAVFSNVQHPLRLGDRRAAYSDVAGVHTKIFRLDL